MSKSKYQVKYHPVFYDTLDKLQEQMSEQEFDEFYDLLMHEINKTLAQDPFNNSRECKFGILSDIGFRTITFQSKKRKLELVICALFLKLMKVTKSTFILLLEKELIKDLGQMGTSTLSLKNC